MSRNQYAAWAALPENGGLTASEAHVAWDKNDANLDLPHDNLGLRAGDTKRVQRTPNRHQLSNKYLKC